MTTANGVLRGLHSSLSAGELYYLSKEFETFYADVYSWKVNKAGEYIWDSLTKENAFGRKKKEKFQIRFLELFKGGTHISPRCGCARHQEMFEDLQKRLAHKQHSWLIDFLDILSAIDEGLHVFLPGRKVDSTTTERLSRFMLLKNFVIHHTSVRGEIARKKVAKEMIEKLAPRCAPGERYDLLWNQKAFGLIQGKLGSYGNAIGERIEPCSGIKPFGTFSYDVWEKSPESSSIETVLCNLGIPFDKNQIWVELKYPATKVCISFKNGRHALACPTVVDARGNWAFRPDRVVDGSHGIARNLMTNKKGMPEIVHKLADITVVEDAIVWPKTRYGWGKNSKLL